MSASLKKSRFNNDKWAYVPSKIKFFVDHDRNAYNKLKKKSKAMKATAASKREVGPDDNLSEDSNDN